MKNAEQLRTVAVDHHSEAVGVFEAYYRDMSQSRFTNAFTYGRFKVDVALDDALRTLPQGARVLDIGCGTGAYVARLRQQGFDAAGIEPAEGMRLAAIRDNPGATIVDAVCTSLPFDDASFDFAFAIEVYRYLHRDDFRTSLKEVLRVLKPGSRFFFTMVNRYALDGFYVLQRVREIVTPGRATTKHPHCEFFTPNELSQELAAAGFVDTQVFGRMLAPLRMAYKVPFAGEALARRLDGLDDAIHTSSVATPFAGHLIAVARRP